MRNLVKDEAIPVTEYEKCVETGKITNPLIEAKKCHFRCLDDMRVQTQYPLFKILLSPLRF